MSPPSGVGFYQAAWAVSSDSPSEMARGGTAGRVKQKRLPAPTWLSTSEVAYVQVSPASTGVSGRILAAKADGSGAQRVVVPEAALGRAAHPLALLFVLGKALGPEICSRIRMWRHRLIQGYRSRRYLSRYRKGEDRA